MPKRFALTPQAQSDLFAIWDYIADDSLTKADRMRDQLFRAFQKLANMPGMGHYREDLADRRHRFWPVYSYLIVYRDKTDPLQIIAIVHGTRELKAFFAKLDEG
jgi:plasmid stabilization system protein ParE